MVFEQKYTLSLLITSQQAMLGFSVKEEVWISSKKLFNIQRFLNVYLGIFRV